MHRVNRTLAIVGPVAVVFATAGLAQVSRGGRGGAPAAPSLMQAAPKPLVPGAPGPQPTGALDALLSWVEEHRPPDTLTAVRRDQTGAITRSRPLCQYPLVARYRGTGSTDDARNFTCSAPAQN